MVLDCKDFHSHTTPNENSPFSNWNTDLFNNILARGCTKYKSDSNTGLIALEDWAKPTEDGNMEMNNVCFPNPRFFGQPPNFGWQDRYSSRYCGNISSTDTIDYFAFPQDENNIFRIIYLDMNLNNEWGNADDFVKSIHLKGRLIDKSDFKKAAENSYSQGKLFFKNLFDGKYNQDIKDLSKYRNAIRGIRNFKSKRTPGDANGEETTDEPTDYSTNFENPAFDAAAEDSAENAAVLDAGEVTVLETEAEVGLETAPETAGTSLLFDAGLIAVTIIASGFYNSFKEDNCVYDDMEIPKRVGSKGDWGCCRGHCAIVGKTSTCVRNANGFNASPFKCCMEDYEWNFKNQTSSSKTISSSDGSLKTTNDLCFNYLNEENQLPKISTCHPYVRDLSSNACSSVVGQYCIGNTPYAENQTSLLDAWNANQTLTFKNKNGLTFDVKAPCLNFIARQLTGGTGFSNRVGSWDDFIKEDLALTPEILNPNGLVTVQNMIENLLNNYLETHGSPIGAINEDEYIESSDFVTWFFNFCGKYPFLCQPSLKNFCSNFSPEELLTKPESIKWCGCYLQDKYYEDYNKYNIEKQCTPICNRADNIPLVGDDGAPILCTSTICMIDDLSIKLAQTFTEGPIDFNQLCHSCGGSKIVKKYNPNYVSQNANNTSEFFQLYPLTTSDYKNLTDFAFNSSPTSSNYKNTSLVGYDRISGGGQYPILEGTNYRIISTKGNSYSNISFNLGVPIVVPGTTDIIYSISSFTDDSVTNMRADGIGNILDPSNPSNNIFKIAVNTTSDVISPLGSDGFFYFRLAYFKAGQTRNNEGDTITQTYIQSIVSDVRQYNVGIADVNCTCTINGNLQFVNSQIDGLNINNNCGSMTCVDDSGNRIPCSSNNIDLSNQADINDNIINSVTVNVDGFNTLTENERNEFLSTSILTFFILISIATILLNKYPKRYIAIVSFLALFTVIALIGLYIYYSNSFQMNNFVDALF